MMAGPAKRSASTNRLTSPPKRRKNSSKRVYAYAEPTLEERSDLPERFRDPYSWPVLRILSEDPEKGYRVEWEPHPLTGQIWKPEWRYKSDVGPGLIKEWKEKQQKQAKRHESVSTPSRASSLTDELEGGQDTSARRRSSRLITGRRELDARSQTSSSPGTPNLTRRISARKSRPIIESSSPAPEVQETQESVSHTIESIQVQLPSGSQIDREDYQTIPNSSASLIRGFDQSSLPLSRDQEEDSALGSSSSDEVSAPASSSFLDADTDSVIGSKSYVPTHSTESIEISEVVPAVQKLTRPRSISGSRQIRQNSGLLVVRNDLVESSPTTSQRNLQIQQTEFVTDTARSSPLFFPEDRAARKNSSAEVAESPTSSSVSRESIGTVSSAEKSAKEHRRFDFPQKNSIPVEADRSENNTSSLLENRAVNEAAADITKSEVKLLDTAPDRESSERSPSLSVQTVHELTVAGAPTSPLRQSPRKKLFRTLDPSIFQSQKARSRPSLVIPSADLALRNVNPQPSPSISRLKNQPSPSFSQPQLSLDSPDQSVQEKTPSNRPSVQPLQDGQGMIDVKDSASLLSPASTWIDSPQIGTASDLGSMSQFASLESSQNPSSAGLDKVMVNMMQAADSEPALSASFGPPTSVYDGALGSSALPLQPSLENSQIHPHATGLDMPRHPLLGPAEYVVPLPAEGKVKDSYLNWIRLEERPLLRFLRKTHPGRLSTSKKNGAELEEVEQLLWHLNGTTTHLDLSLDGPATQMSDASAKEADWANYVSSKFRFLGRLIELLRNRDCSIVVMAKEGATLQLLENYVRHKRVDYRRPPEFVSSEAYRPENSEGPLRVVLLATNVELESKLARPPSLILAFDDSFNTRSPFISSIRNKAGVVAELAPVIYLLIVNSAEHISRCLSQDIPARERVRLILKAAYHLSHRLGGKPDSHLNIAPQDHVSAHYKFVASKENLGSKIDMAAERVAFAVNSDNFDSKWMLEPIEELDLDGIDDKPSEADRGKSSTPGSRAGTPQRQKRILEAENAGPGILKRQRFTPIHDVTHISDSVKDSQSQLDSLQQTLQKTQQELNQEKESRRMFEESLGNNTRELEGFKKSLSKLQHRYETRTNMMHDLRRVNDKLEKGKVAMVALQEKTILENIALKEERTRLGAELAATREEMKGGGGTLAELEAARGQARQLAEKNASLEKSHSNLRKDFDFLRAQYQDASNKAADFAGQVTQLEREALELKQKASDEKRRLREVNYKADTTQHLARVLELEAMLKNREAILQGKEDEVKALRRGRGVATRGSSVQPASPRGGPGSRGGSPAPASLLAAGGGTGTHVGGSRTSLLRHER